MFNECHSEMVHVTKISFSSMLLKRNFFITCTIKSHKNIGTVEISFNEKKIVNVCLLWLTNYLPWLDRLVTEQQHNVYL
jgi:hypothetical protein